MGRGVRAVSGVEWEVPRGWFEELEDVRMSCESYARWYWGGEEAEHIGFHYCYVEDGDIPAGPHGSHVHVGFWLSVPKEIDSEIDSVPWLVTTELDRACAAPIHMTVCQDGVVSLFCENCRSKDRHFLISGLCDVNDQMGDRFKAAGIVVPAGPCEHEEKWKCLKWNLHKHAKPWIERHLKCVGYAGYAEYMKSARWRAKRNEVLLRDGFKCIKCRSHRRLQVHHLNYERLGNEDLNDLATLCAKCHREVEGRP